MEQVDQIIYASWVIPVSPTSDSLGDHGVAISGDKILAIGPRSEIANAFVADNTLDLKEHALIPGFVNCHTHAAMSLFRGLADDLPLQEWLENHIWPAEAAVVDSEFVYDGTALAAAEMLASGTTCFNDMYFFPGEAAAAAIDCGIRAVVGMIVIGFPSAWAENVDDYLSNGQKVHDRYRAHPQIHTAFAPHAPYTVDDDALRRVATLAEELDVPIHMHVHETPHEVAQSLATHGKRPLARLEQLGLLSHRLVAVHMTTLDPEEIDQVVRAGVSIVHCPESNLKLASGFCPLATLLERGAKIALGTDGAGSNNDLDMFGEMRSAALLAKGVAQSAAVAPAAEILRMATFGGAQALGLEDRIGTLEPGKFADIVAVDLSGIGSIPVYDPVSQIVYAGHRDQVSNVWVAGRQVIRDREPLSFNTLSVVNNARRWQEKIKGG